MSPMPTKLGEFSMFMLHLLIDPTGRQKTGICICIRIHVQHEYIRGWGDGENSNNEILLSIVRRVCLEICELKLQIGDSGDKLLFLLSPLFLHVHNALTQQPVVIGFVLRRWFPGHSQFSSGGANEKQGAAGRRLACNYATCFRHST